MLLFILTTDSLPRGLQMTYWDCYSLIAKPSVTGAVLETGLSIRKLEDTARYVGLL